MVISVYRHFQQFVSYHVTTTIAREEKVRTNIENCLVTHPSPHHRVGKVSGNFVYFGW